MREITLPLPPLAEQHRIVVEIDRHFARIDAAEQTVGANLRRAERLRQSILKRAFEGRLVPQDPGDERGSVPLERIKAKREAQDAPKPKRIRKTRIGRRKPPEGELQATPAPQEQPREPSRVNQ